MHYARAYASGEWLEINFKDGLYFIEISNDFRRLYFAVCKHLGEVKELLQLLDMPAFGKLK